MFVHRYLSIVPSEDSLAMQSSRCYHCRAAATPWVQARLQTKRLQKARTATYKSSAFFDDEEKRALFLSLTVNS